MEIPTNVRIAYKNDKTWQTCSMVGPRSWAPLKARMAPMSSDETKKRETPKWSIRKPNSAANQFFIKFAGFLAMLQRILSFQTFLVNGWASCWDGMWRWCQQTSKTPICLRCQSLRFSTPFRNELSWSRFVISSWASLLLVEGVFQFFFLVQGVRFRFRSLRNGPLCKANVLRYSRAITSLAVRGFSTNWNLKGFIGVAALHYWSYQLISGLSGI